MEKNVTRTLIVLAVILGLFTLACVQVQANPFREQGEKSTRQFKLKPGLYLFEVDHRGFSNFKIDFRQAGGAVIKNLAQGVGPYLGITVVGIPKTEQGENAGEGEAPMFYIAGETDGEWIVSVKSTINEPGKRNFSGTTETRDATPVFKLKAGTYDFKVKHTGGRQFSAVLLNNYGAKVEDLASGIGSVTETKRVKIPRESDFIIDITASGEWTIEVDEVLN